MPEHGRGIATFAPFTVFAPTHAAFGMLPAGTVDNAR
jgi:uncharacterized surface protein with fasciclin (FAS1) repeats